MVRALKVWALFPPADNVYLPPSLSSCCFLSPQTSERARERERENVCVCVCMCARACAGRGRHLIQKQFYTATTGGNWIFKVLLIVWGHLSTDKPSHVNTLRSLVYHPTLQWHQQAQCKHEHTWENRNMIKIKNKKRRKKERKQRKKKKKNNPPSIITQLRLLTTGGRCFSLLWLHGQSVHTLPGLSTKARFLSSHEFTNCFTALQSYSHL